MLGLLTQYPIVGLTFLLAIVLALTIHEFAHAFVAYLYGDHTAEQQGRLTFNPFAHLDMYGSVLFLLIGFGWGKPVPTNPLNFKKRKEGEIMVALAGPASNLLFAIITAGIFWIIGPGLLPTNLLYIFLIFLFQINIMLMIFNLIPIPPLDGSHVLNNVLSDRYYKFKAYLMTYGPQTLFLVIVVAQVMNIRIFAWIGSITGWFMKVFGLPVIF